jgi:hypothetical protein
LTVTYLGRELHTLTHWHPAGPQARLTIHGEHALKARPHAAIRAARLPEILGRPEYPDRGSEQSSGDALPLVRDERSPIEKDLKLRAARNPTEKTRVFVGHRQRTSWIVYVSRDIEAWSVAYASH